MKTMSTKGPMGVETKSTQNDTSVPDTGNSGGARGIEPTQVHEILRNERRRRAIECLMESEGTVSVRALAERIAEMETGESPPPCGARKSVYVTLHQNHLSKLEKAGLAERVPGGVRKGENIEEVGRYVKGDEEECVWAGACAAVSLAGILTIGVAALGLAAFPPLEVLAFFFFVVIFFVSVYAVSHATKAPMGR